MKRYLQIFSLILIACSINSTCLAQTSVNKTLQRFVTPDVEAIVHVDLTQVDFPALAKAFSRLEVYDPEQQTEVKRSAEETQQLVQKYRDAGVESIFVLVRMTDLAHGGTTVVMKTNGPDSASRLMQQYQASISSNATDDLFAELRPSQMNLNVVDSVDEYLVAAASQPQLDAALQQPASVRKLGDTPTKLLSNSFGMLLLGTADSRKAIGQIGLDLPAPFQEITGSFIADQVDWAGVSLSLNQQMSLELQFYSENSASDVRRVIETALKNAPAEQLSQWTGLPKMKSVTDALEVTESAGIVTVSTAKIFADPEAFRTMVGPLEAIRVRARETQMMNNLRQVILAMHNHESAFKQFPAKYSTDESGKPLLSWRVKILPFLNRNELYKQFKLDEPWDSDHNKKLIPLMPEIYADLNTGRTGNNQAGKTIVQVPAGPGTAFESGDSVEFRDIKDGSSNTIMIVNVAQDKAVYWTQPADWEVDPKKATAGLVGNKRKRIPVALGDGSIQVLPATVDPATLYKLLTVDGGEVVRWPEEGDEEIPEGAVRSGR